MPVQSAWVNIDGARVATALQEVIDNLRSADGEVVLDFSPVERVDPVALKAMEKLAGIAGEKSVKVVLRGVSVGVYKALKLMNLTGRFSFAG